MGQSSSFILPGKIIRIIIGIGNPGYFFSNTRHNVGIIFIDHLIKQLNLEIKKITGGEIAFLKQSEGYVAIFKSNNYMNLSGYSVHSALELCKITNIDDVIIMHDDLETKFNKIKFQAGGSAKGHRGIKSVIEMLNKTEFKRIRIGIGRPQSRNRWIVSAYVTSSFSGEENKLLEEQGFSQCIDILKEEKFL